jgi:hypothetical protein
VIREATRIRTPLVAGRHPSALAGAAAVTVAAAVFGVGGSVASDTGGMSAAVVGEAQSPPSESTTAEAIKDLAFAPGP